MNNLFNGTHSVLGAPVSTPADLPQLTGTPASLSGMDIDIVDVSSKLTAGETSVAISATSTGDTYFLASLILATTYVDTTAPDHRIYLPIAVR
jgi:hypothetical protein